jgi:hypothetical protein
MGGGSDVQKLGEALASSEFCRRKAARKIG